MLLACFVGLDFLRWIEYEIQFYELSEEFDGLMFDASFDL
jgi:hypothetical protein